MFTKKPAPRSRAALLSAAACLVFTGCHPAAAPPAQAPQAMPVQVQPVSLSPVPVSDTYVATIKSRRSSTMQPQVDGNLTRIFVTSGQAVKAGQVLMQIDPLKQVAAVQTQQGLEQQQKALYQYNQGEVERQKKLYDAGITSRQVYDQAVQSFQNSKGAFDSSAAGTNTQRQQLAYYQIRAPFAGIVGDIPVHLGDYVSATTVLTTVDEDKDLEAYIYLPTERSTEVHTGLPVDLIDTAGSILAHSTINFVSPQVDNSLQSILAKAPIPASSKLRNQQIVNARVTWSTNQTATVPVLAVTRVGGQTFVYVATPRGSGFMAHQVSVNLGEAVGNAYPVISGLKPGDKVILSGIQFLQEGVPVQPLPGGPPPPPPTANARIRPAPETKNEDTPVVEFFIRRPIFATVCALLIVLAGAVSLPTIPISLYPQLAPPQVLVSCNYVGANSQDVESAVTIILEQAINGVEGMRYISSTSSNDGTSSITVTFNTGYDLDIAAVDVQNRVATAQGRLPATVNNTGISITKANSNFVFAAGFISTDKSLSPSFISNYLDVYVSDALKRVPGVGAVVIFGERKYAMRLWLDPNKLAARGLTPLDVTNALASQNVEIAAGQLGQPPSDPHQAYQMAVRVVGRLSDPRQFENIILKSSAPASAAAASAGAVNTSGLVLLKDVGRAEVGAENYNTDLKFSGGDAVGVGVQQLSNANALDVDKKCRAVLAELEKSFPPSLKGIIAVDTTTVISDSIVEVEHTLAEAILIVIIVIFLFLQDWRATIIPAVTIPVSLVGTFAFIKIFGFSINSLTLFGITLATGLVVDDAIVVIENVQRHLEEGAESAMEATSIAMREVTSAVIATSLVLISVFVPVSFFPGTTGILYKQFSLTIAFSIAISAFNALTLSPALAAILLRRESESHGRGPFRRYFLDPIDHGIKKLISWYAVAVTFVVRIRYVVLVVFLVSLAATVFMYTHVPTAFVPVEDQSYFLIIIQTPPGASLTYTSEFADRVSAKVRQDKDVFGTFSVMGFSLAGGSSPNSGLIFAPLKPIDDRTKLGKGHDAHSIVGRIAPELFQVPGGIAFAAEPPAIAGIGTVGGFQFILQDAGRNTFGDIDRVAHTIVGQTRAPGTGLMNLNTTFTANDPQLFVTIDRQKALAVGVPLTQITAAMGTFMGSSYVNDFDFNNRSYRVYVQADQQFRRNAQDLRQYYVRSDSGQMIPLDNLLLVNETSGPQVINHYNLFRSAEIDGSPAQGLSSGQGLANMEKLFNKNKMPGMTFSWTGLSLEEIESSGKAIIIFGLGLLVVYLTLSAQYESFALPFIILLAVPTAILGALSLVALRGLDDDVYVQIGLVMLIGLSAKNSILIVEFAEQQLSEGKTIIEAAITASELRLRPILMTSFAFILGVLPLYFASGAGALGRHSVGTAVVGGMLLSTLLNLFFIPVLYVLLKTLLSSFSKKKLVRKSPTQPAH